MSDLTELAGTPARDRDEPFSPTVDATVAAVRRPEEPAPQPEEERGP